MYNIPLFDLNYNNAEIEAVVKTLESRWISMGPKTMELESLFEQKLAVKHAVAVSNCTDSLHLACVLCGFQEGDEVLVPSLTFAASVNCVRYVGATPIFCDITSNVDLNINPIEIEKKITKKTKGIIVVHMAGFPANMNEIMRIAKQYNLKVIEDACHGPLSEYDGKKLGTIGDVGCFSFFSNKNISTGEGGMLVTNNDSYAERAKLLRSHGMTTMSFQRATGHATEYDIVDLGYNYRLDDIRATLGIVQLNKLYDDLKKRETIRKLYEKLLIKETKLSIPFSSNTNFVSNYIFPTVLNNSTKEIRNQIRNDLQQLGIQTSVHYPPIHKFSVYQDYTTSLPVTEYVSDNEITLPMYANLDEDKIMYICENYIKLINKYL